jgi:hypothetical protein
VTTVSGKLENPQTSTAKAILRLIQNAFFKTILPGFEKAIGQPSKDQTTRKAQEMAATAKKQPKQ